MLLVRLRVGLARPGRPARSARLRLPVPVPDRRGLIEIELSDPHPKPQPLCGRHHDDWLDVVADIARARHTRVEVIGPWLDDE